MKVLFICFTDFSRADSGSSVRPQKMYRAFLEAGHEVKLLAGSDGNDRRAERKKNVAEVNHWLDTNKPDICYIESPTGQIMLDCDIRLMKRLHHMRVPTGVFLRDFHRKFPEVFPRRKGFANTLKEIYLDIRQRKMDKVLEIADIIYLPSEESIKLFDYKDMRPLPPAGENNLLHDKLLNKTCIYVGGICQQYGFDMVLDAYAILNAKGDEYKLIACVRENEWRAYVHPQKNMPWLEVHHASGEELDALYDEASIAVLSPRGGNIYNSVAVSVKLFEYMSYGLPIVAQASGAMDRIVKKYNIGIVAENTPDSLARAIYEIINDESKYREYTKNCREALLGENLWIHRVNQVTRDLREKKKYIND